MISTRFALCLFTLGAVIRCEAQTQPPIIDVHLHAMSAKAYGPPPVPVCAAQMVWRARDQMEAYETGSRLGTAKGNQYAECDSPIQSASDDNDLMTRTLQIMTRYNVTGVVSGSMERVRRWREAAPERIIPALQSDGRDSIESIRAGVEKGDIRVLGELTFQYQGLSPSDAVPERYFSLAEQLDIPVAVHAGPGPPGAAYVGTPNYRMSLSDPLLYEEMLVRHPKLRIYLMHAGWPMADRMIALMYAHPQVYADVAVIDWVIPRKEFHAYLRRLVDAGFGKRILFGSDQMIWPDTLRIAIESIETADFLTAEQKRDIFYNNAVRFLRLPQR